MSSSSQAPILLLDGGLGTTLADQYNVTYDDSTPLWSSQLLITNPGKLKDVQGAFAAAGADIILTATYQASYEGFARSGVSEDEAGRKMRSAVLIARDAFASRPDGQIGKVALSLGAYGATMIPGQEYSGAYDSDHAGVESLKAWHFNRLEAFFPVSGRETEAEREKREYWDKIDLIAFETLPRRDEIIAVRGAMGYLSNHEKEGASKPFWICCVFPGESKSLPDGSSIPEVAGGMLGKINGARIPMGIGINCTKVGKVESLIAEFENAIKEMAEKGEINEWPSLVVYPDGTNGEVYNTTTHEWEKKSVGDSSVSSSSFSVSSICVS